MQACVEGLGVRWRPLNKYLYISVTFQTLEMLDSTSDIDSEDLVANSKGPVLDPNIKAIKWIAREITRCQ